MDYCNCDSAELAAAVNAAASIWARGRSIEEIEMLAILFDMLSDTLFAIALLQKKQEHLRRRRDNPT